MSSWAAITKPTQKTDKKIVFQKPTPVETGRAFAFASKAKATSNSTSSSTSKSKVVNAWATPRTQELKQMQSSGLTQDCAGLNLTFGATPGAPTQNSTPSTGRATQKAAVSEPIVEKPKVELTKAQLAKRTKQITYGRNTAGYKNYLTHVPKDTRVSGNDKHPQTPKPNHHKLRSKRQFAGAVKGWKRALHAWDTKGPFTVEDMKAAAVAAAAAVTATATTAAVESETEAFSEKRQMRTKSWADMADSDDSDSDEDTEMNESNKTDGAKPPSPEFTGLRTKRKARDELLPARMEKKANVQQTEESEKPMSALQKAKARIAARKAGSQ